MLKKSIAETVQTLDAADKEAYRKLVAPLGSFPAHPFLMANFGLKSLRSARGFAEKYFTGERARAVFAGCAAHSMIPLEDVPGAAVGFILTLTAHAVGWGFPRGGTQKLSDALAAYFLSLGGEIQINRRVENVDELPPSRAVLFDLSPRQIVKIAGHRLPARYRRRLENYRYGAGVFKMDFALSEPVPWRAKECALAGTVHLGGTLDEIAAAERRHADGHAPGKPFVLLAQTSLFDSTRAPDGKHTLWAYAHVPNNSAFDMTESIENQIERFAPGFRDCILAKSIMSPFDLEKYNANYIGGDISGGANILSQFFTRPLARWNPYSMPVKGFYICSASTPPGGGVHGMCGFYAAKSALASEFKINLKRLG